MSRRYERVKNNSLKKNRLFTPRDVTSVKQRRKPWTIVGMQTVHQMGAACSLGNDSP